MKFGCCIGTNTEKAAALKKYGYDYAELNVNAFANLEETAFCELLDKMRETGIPCEAACCFIPSEIKIVGPASDRGRLSDYIARAAYRSSLFGIRTIVFGSGGARKIPEGVSHEDGIAQIISFLRDTAAPETAKYGIEIAIEPLCSSADNAIHTVEQGVAVAEKTGCPNVKGLADIYHMIYNNDDINNILSYKGKIIHAHTSYPWDVNGRRMCPLKEFTDYDQYDFLNALYNAGCPRISVEASIGDDYEKDISESVEVLKEAYGRVLAANNN